jgi:AmpD protein
MSTSDPALAAMALDAKREWLTGVRRVPSPNRDARATDTSIDTIVIHGISLPPGKYGGPYIERLFTNSLDVRDHPYFSEICGMRVSAHLLITRTGQVTQFVPFSERARHAGVSVFHGRPDCNEYSIGIELEGCDDEAYEPCQYRLLAGIVNLLRRNWPDITPDRIIGHCHVAPDRKTDPGPAFDWGYFKSLIE